MPVKPTRPNTAVGSHKKQTASKAAKPWNDDLLESSFIQVDTLDSPPIHQYVRLTAAATPI